MFAMFGTAVYVKDLQQRLDDGDRDKQPTWAITGAIKSGVHRLDQLPSVKRTSSIPLWPPLKTHMLTPMAGTRPRHDGHHQVASSHGRMVTAPG